MSNKSSCRFVICLIIGVFTWTSSVMGQGAIMGTITDDESISVPFVNLQLRGTTLGVSSNEEGNYRLENVPTGTYTMIASAIGYAPWRSEVQVRNGETTQLDLKLVATEQQLNEFVVTGTMKETYVSASPVKVEVLSAKLLEQSVSANLMEALYQVNGVQEQVNCGVCATNDIHINGMEGPYTLVLIDGMPIMSALASVYGFNGLPTSLIERVEIVKGPSSTLYGTEAVGGVINIITKSPEDAPLAYVNLSGSTHEEWNADVSLAPKVSERVQGLISGSFQRNDLRMDFNEDGFTDIPMNERLSLFTKWQLKRPEGRRADVAVRFYDEERFGGVLDWDDRFKGSDSVYGEYIETQRVEVIGSYQLPTKPHLRIDYSFNNHAQDSYYGDSRYKADQSVYFANFLWNHTASRHDLLVGGTFRYQTYSDNSLAFIDDKRFIPGVFAQDEFAWTDKTSLLSGVRVDFHREHGIIVAPRFNVKQKLGMFTTARLNLGTGFRQVNLFTEDHAALSGARTVVIRNALKPESSFNATLNLNHVYSIGKSYGSIDLDAFYTYFGNKIVPDYDTDPNFIIYDNLSGYGITRGISLNVEHKFTFPLSVRVGGTYQDVYEGERNSEGVLVKHQQLFAPRFSGVFSASYEWKPIGLSLRWSGRVMGPQRLPSYDAPYERPEVSPWFSLQHLRLSKTVGKRWETYVGVKNILNYTQPTPLIAPEDPFGNAFDTAYAYGPLQVRRVVLGLRFRVARG